MMILLLVATPVTGMLTWHHTHPERYISFINIKYTCNLSLYFMMLTNETI